MKSKDNKVTTQRQSILLHINDNIATNSMISEATGIPRPSICRYKKQLEEEGLLIEVERKRCKITNFPAWYLTGTKNTILNKTKP